MMRNLAVSIWILCLTLGFAYFGAKMQREPAAANSQPAADAPTLIALKAMTVPVIANGAMQGYVLAQISVSATPEALKTLPQPADVLIADSVFNTLYAEEQVDFKHLRKQDLSKLSNKILENINAKTGVPLASGVFIQELHYLSKQEVGAAAQYR
ncbi:MAG: hypothetical protein WAK07_19270 [Rhodomicrobium sp.]